MLTENLEIQVQDLHHEENIEDCYIPIDEPIMNIKTTLLKPQEITIYGNRLVEDYSFDKAGTNGVFEAIPKLVKFKGFELNKKCSIKIQLVNKSKFSQRVTILAPTTPFFKIKYSRKGLIAPGLSEVIILSFTPQNYIYYNDYIRIICEGDKMVIPIHAFPKMNTHMKDYIPKFVDLGTVPINTELSKIITLRNIIDKPFEFELVPIKQCEEIKIDTVCGIIDSFSNKNITINFTPQSYGFFICEYEFRLSEMDYQPSVISISGSCNVFDKVLNENIIKHMKRLKEPDIKSEYMTSSNSNNNKNTKISITNENINSDFNFKNETQITPLPNISIELHKLNPLNEKTLNLSPIKTNSKLTDSPTKGISKKFKNFPSNKEREYLNYYNNVDGVIKDKEIKYIKFIGKKLLADDQITKIINERVKEFENNLMIKRKIDLNRHSFEIDTEKCIVDRKNQYIIKPTFNFNQNDKFFKTRHYFNLFLKNMTKILINNRASSRLKKIKEMITKNNIKSVDDYGEFVEKDWANQFNQDTENGEDKIKLKFVYPKSLTRGEVYLSHDFNIDSLKQMITHENNINLEELTEFDYLERSEYEVFGYKDFKSTGMTLYEISTEEKIQRLCGENEQVVRGERGDSEMAYDKVLSLIEMPESNKNHIDTKIDTLLFNNPSFKKYVSYNNFTETAIDYNLQPRFLTETLNPNSNYSNELHSKLPLSIYENINFRDLDNYNLIGDTSLDLTPNKLKTPDERDLNIKYNEKVDEDNYLFDLAKDDEEKLMNEFEKDDEAIKGAREANKYEVCNHKTKEKINLENYLQAQKRKWMATIPTVLEYYNSGVINSNNKFLL